MNSMILLRLLILVFVLATAQLLHSQEPAKPGVGRRQVESGRSSSTLDLRKNTIARTTARLPQRKRALIFCGHPGDDEHRQQYSETIEALYNGLTTYHGFRPDDVWIQFGSSITGDDNAALKKARGKCTRVELRKTVTELRSVLSEEDSLWVVAMGHSHFDGRKSWFNLPGSDIEQDEFGKLFADMNCREQVFWITIPASGFYIRPLSRKGRIVISATEADREANETLFPYVLADVLNSPIKPEDFDADGDRSISLFDLFVNVTKQIAQNYIDENAILTEHAWLDDNGDGRGTNVQLDYLPPDLGGRKTDSFTPKHLPNRDGTRAARSRFHNGRKRSRLTDESER